MLNSKIIGVVVPAHNEEDHIRQVVETMPELVDIIYVVDDNSADQTAAIVQQMKSMQPGRIVYLKHNIKTGVGAAIVTGYQQAIRDDVSVMAVMAGDGQMDPAELESVVRPAVENRADYVKGNRFHYGTSWEVMPRYRFIGNAMLSFLTKISSGYWKLSDFQTGYTALSLEMAKRLPLTKLYRQYGFPNDILVKLNVLNARIREVPIKPIYRGEKSGIRVAKVIPRISWLLVKDFFWRLREKYVVRDFHPLVFFYFFGGVSTLLGLIFGIYLIIYRIVNGPVSETSALFAALFFLFGSQALFFAMWFDMESNKELQQ